MGPYVLAKNFTFSFGDNVQVFRGDWIPVDSQFDNWNVHVHLQTLDPSSPTTGIKVDIETSYDTVESETVGTTITLAATGSSDSSITANMLGLVRLRLTNGDNASLSGTISVWLQPKSK